jgi:hypothetical protein
VFGQLVGDVSEVSGFPLLSYSLPKSFFTDFTDKQQRAGAREGRAMADH